MSTWLSQTRKRLLHVVADRLAKWWQTVVLANRTALPGEHSSGNVVISFINAGAPLHGHFHCLGVRDAELITLTLPGEGNRASEVPQFELLRLRAT